MNNSSNWSACSPIFSNHLSHADITPTLFLLFSSCSDIFVVGTTLLLKHIKLTAKLEKYVI